MGACDLNCRVNQDAFYIFTDIFNTDKTHLKAAIVWLSDLLEQDFYPDDNLNEIFFSLTKEECLKVISEAQNAFY